MAVIGIDLGTTNSLCCVWQNGESILIPNSLGEYLTPSVVSVDINGDILTGRIARERLITHPERSASSFKQYMGTDKIYQLGKKKFRPEDLSSIILRRLKEDAEVFLGEPVTEAVISVPAYFNNDQRTMTKLAGQLAGMKVERIVNEPSAAALAYQNLTKANGTYLVIDFGGGTLDISVVDIFDNIVDIIAVAGDNHLGGDNIDSKIMELFFETYPGLKEKLNDTEMASVRKMAEQCKITLSSADRAMMQMTLGSLTYDLILTNQLLADTCALILAEIKAAVSRVLKDSHRHNKNIDDIVLVGGSCRMTVIKSYIEFITGKKLRSEIDPDKAVAIGVGLVTGIKERDENIQEMIMTDICPYTLGISIVNPGSRKDDIFSPIIERNSALPASKVSRFVTASNNQKYFDLDIYQGESPYVKNNIWLGQIHMPIPAAPAGDVQVDLRLSYDINGILEADATCLQTGKNKKKLIVSNKHMSKSEIFSRRFNLQRYKTPLRTLDQNRYLLERSNRLYEEITGTAREIIQQETALFYAALENNHPSELERARLRLANLLDKLEKTDSAYLGGEQ